MPNCISSVPSIDQAKANHCSTQLRAVGGNQPSLYPMQHLARQGYRGAKKRWRRAKLPWFGVPRWVGVTITKWRKWGEEVQEQASMLLVGVRGLRGSFPRKLSKTVRAVCLYVHTKVVSVPVLRVRLAVRINRAELLQFASILPLQVVEWIGMEWIEISHCKSLFSYG